MSKFGISTETWESAKQEAKGAILQRAKVKKTLTYSDLVGKISAMPFSPDDPRLFELLGELSIEGDAAGLGMISALVVHKTGDLKPGPGFFELAKRLGRNTSDGDKCWVAELNNVFIQSRNFTLEASGDGVDWTQ